MMRRIISGLIGCGIFALLVFSTELPDQWRSWRYSRVAQTSPQANANGSAELVRLLLDNKADIKARNNGGGDALDTFSILSKNVSYELDIKV